MDLLLAHSRLCHRTPTAFASPPGAGEGRVQCASARGGSSGYWRGGRPAGAGEGLGSGCRRGSIRGRRRGSRQRAPTREHSRALARAWAAGAVIVLLPPLRHGRRCAAASLLQIWMAPPPHPDPLTAAPEREQGEQRRREIQEEGEGPRPGALA